ncbi:MAG: hypothetical protein IJ545_02035 [Alphaproteobacteria bacterium]|nr:hypothetical protein [Alphaproteobacteria bacterium]
MQNESLEDNFEPPVSERLPEKEKKDDISNEVIKEKEDEKEHQEKINAVHHWVDEMFTKEQERLTKQGISSAKEWIELMAAIDKALAEHPAETFGFLAQRYGITLPKQESSNIKPEIIQCLKNLEQNQINLWKALQAQSAQTTQLTISNFASAKDDEGKLLHPQFPIVRNEMFALLSNGIATDFESAYEKALWINPQTRSELLQKQEAENLQYLAEEADKAKAAGFSPEGSQEKEDISQMTTRELLEHNYKKLEG